MFKFLKNKQNIQLILAYAFVFIVVVWSSSFWFDDSSEQLDQLDQEMTTLSEEVVRLGQALDDYVKFRSNTEDSLRESNELLQTGFEQYKELFIHFEQRITFLQDVLNDADLNSTGLTAARVEIADFLQSLKSINETEMADLAE